MGASKADQDIYNQTFAMSADSDGITTMSVTGPDEEGAERTVTVDLTPELMSVLLANITRFTFGAAIIAGMNK